MLAVRAATIYAYPVRDIHQSAVHSLEMMERLHVKANQQIEGPAQRTLALQSYLQVLQQATCTKIQQREQL